MLITAITLAALTFYAHLHLLLGNLLAGSSNATRSMRYHREDSVNKFSFTHRAFPSFLILGLLGLLVNTTALILLREQLGLSLLAASLLAGEIALVHNYFLHRIWTFQRSQVRLRHILLFHVMALITLTLSSSLLLGMVQFVRLSYPLANVIAVLVASACNYLLIECWVWLDLPVRPSKRARLTRAAILVQARALRYGRAMLVPIATMSIILLSLGWVIRGTPGGWAPLAGLLFGAALVVRPEVASCKAIIFMLAAAVGISSVDYLAWRLAMTNWSNWWISVPLFVAELFGALHTLGLQYTAWPRPEPHINASDDPTHRPIFIFIPTVDEGPRILEPTLQGALTARDRYLQRFPLAQVSIIVCNDGRVARSARWFETEMLAKQMGVDCITRLEGGGAKAGNIESARQQVGATGDALVVIFDADQIAEPEFLLKTVPPFADPTIAWVQTGQYYSNLGNPIARWANDQQALFYQVLCPGKAAQNAAFICGTNVVLRAAALDEIGGLPQDSVTEDFAASIELHPRWRSIFLPDVLARGLGPMDLKSYFGQQRRWAAGTLGVLRSHWREIFLPGHGGLSLPQRIQYALACTHYLCGIRDLIYIIAPLIFLSTGIAAVQGSTLPGFVWHFLPYWLLSQLAFWYVAWRKTTLRGIIIGFGSFPVLIGSFLSVVLQRRIGFTVTAKQRSTARVRDQLQPHLLAIAACLLGLGLAIRSGLQQGPVLVSTIWVIYTLMMLGGVVWLGLADRRAARQPQLGAERATQRFVVRRSVPMRLAVRPALVGAAAVAIGGVMATPTLLWGQPAQFQPRQELGRPYFGISLPSELLESRPPEIESKLGLEFAIVGRTQVISDRFDRTWADRLAARGDRPWITLLFGVPGQSSLESSLPAIANGIHDDALRDWARDIRAYGKPVYLTILPHVDRNWSLSSAVAHGGIPQDVPRAWSHVQAIFREAGATNVAWTWAPADPTQDQAYAPPSETIDITVLSLISFPNDTWANPAKALAAVAVRHPGTPVFLEVSASGRPERKAEWLRQVGGAVARSQNVYALLYHEGAPAEQASMQEHQAWSLDSDAQSLNAIRDAAKQAGVRTSADPGHK
jgi:cellulose synthase/poly-beta-1,6-N-acetylglucosamine synthase-like glycosyltransferase/putative flippase GtrA